MNAEKYALFEIFYSKESEFEILRIFLFYWLQEFSFIIG